LLDVAYLRNPGPRGKVDTGILNSLWKMPPQLTVAAAHV